MTLALHGYPDWQRPFNTGDLSFDSGQQTLFAGNSYTSALLDMRPYNTFGASFDIRRGGVDANPREMRCHFGWANDGFETGQIWEDSYSIHAQNATAGGGACDNGILYVQGPVLGPYMRVSMTNTSPVTLTGEAVVIGNSRTAPGMFAREVAAALGGSTARDDERLISELINVGAGATVLRCLKLRVGRVWMRFESTTALGTFTLTAADGTLMETIAPAAGVVSRTEMVFGRQSMQLRINNATGAAANYRATIVHQPDIW